MLAPIHLVKSNIESPALTPLGAQFTLSPLAPFKTKDADIVPDAVAVIRFGVSNAK